jgi:putative transposase
MKKTKFTESQIVTILKQQESGISVKDICRENGISQLPRNDYYHCVYKI